jgi:hypothetical protein
MTSSRVVVLISGPRFAVWAVCVVCAACAAAPAPKPIVAPPPLAAEPDPQPRNEKVREELQLAPWDLAFSAVRGTGQVTETVTARNLTDDAVLVRALAVVGDDRASFQLRDPPKLPITVPAKGGLSVAVTFAPSASTPLGVQRALLRFQTGPLPEDGPGADLSGLANLGRVGDHEPTLAQVVESLGYAVDVQRPTAGAAAPASRSDKGEKDDEIVAPLFTRASPTLVALNPVARFSADGARPFGHYLLQEKTTAPKTLTLATLVSGQHQTLNPELESGGNASFDPGDAPFGIWVKVDKRKTLFSEDQRNKGADKHVARVFPLHARGGASIPNAYLIAFNDGSDDAFQDCVFVLWNVKPVAAPGVPPKAPASPVR